MAQATNSSIAADQTGTQYRTQDNDRYAAALTQHSGSSRPSYAVAGTEWLDTSGTPWIVKHYDGIDDIVVGYIDPTGNTYTPAGVDLPGWGGTSTGAANVFAVTTGSGVTAYTAGLVVRFKTHQANTGAATLNVNGLGAKDLRKRGAVVLGSNDVLSGATLVCIYDGTNFQIVGGLASQDTLVSGINIKTLNGVSLLGSGDITVATDQTQLQNNTIINAIRLLSTTSSYALLAGGYADSFNDGLGVDWGQSYGVTYDSTNKLVNVADPRTTAMFQFENNVTDSSGYNLTATNTNVTFVTSPVKNGTYSASFNGTSSYISVASPGASAVFPGDFTVEVWVYQTSTTSERDIFDCRATSSSTTGFLLATWATTGNVAFYTGTTTSFNTTPLTQNAWNHVAVTRSGSTITLWINGVSNGTITNSTNFSDGVISIGRNSSTGLLYFAGYIDSLRISKFARYTTTFTPTAALTDGQLDVDRCTTLLHFENNVTDSAATPLTYTATNLTYSNSIYKFGSYSAAFNGTSSYISVASPGSASKFGGDFTVEAWVYPTSFTNIASIFDSRTAQVNTTGIVLYTLNSSGYLCLDKGGSTVVHATTNGLTLNAWNHVAVTRSGSTITIWANGVSVGAATDSSNFSDGAILIGKVIQNIFYWPGQIDEFRIINGYAAYQTAFTPSPRAFVSGVASAQLISQPFTALTAPTTVRAVSNVTPIDTLTYATDVVDSVSRDNGTTFTAASIADAGAWDSLSRIVSGSATVSGQPSGTAIVRKITAPTNLAYKINSIGELWS